MLSLIRAAQRHVLLSGAAARSFACDAQSTVILEKPGILPRNAPLVAGEVFFDFALRDEAAARNALKKWCSKRTLASTGLLDSSVITKTHLPFWTFDAIVDIRWKGAPTSSGLASSEFPDHLQKLRVVGFKSGGKGVRLQSVLTWREERNKLLPGSEPSQQVYAGFDLRPDLVHGVVVPPRQSARGSDAPHRGAQAAQRGMGRGVAWRLARLQMHRAAELRASAALKAELRADLVHSLEVEIEVKRLSSKAVRLPAYVFGYSHGTTINPNREFSAEQHTAVVCGTTGNVGGDELMSENKARVAGGALAAASGLVLDSFSSGAINLGAAGLEWVFLAGIAGTLAGVYARWLPKSKREVEELKRIRAAEQTFEASRGKVGGGGEWTDEWLQRRRDLLEWFRWVETERTHWDGQKRAEWAANLLRGQAERARERIRWREAQEAAAQQQEEEERRAETKKGKYGDASEKRKAAAAGRDKSDPLGYFEILELDLSACEDLTDDQVKAAFRAAAMKWHPDKHLSVAGKEKAAVGFRKLQGAYDVVKDPKKRAQYVNNSGGRGWHTRA